MTAVTSFSCNSYLLDLVTSFNGELSLLMREISSVKPLLFDYTINKTCDTSRTVY